MANGKISPLTKHGSEGGQTGCSFEYEQIGKLVVFHAVITHPQTSWSVITGIPRPLVDDTIVGVLADYMGTTIKCAVYITTIGDGAYAALQVRTATFNDVYKLDGAYITRD